MIDEYGSGPRPVGGRIVPANKYELLGPWIGLIAVISLTVVVVFWRVKNITLT